MYFTNLCVASYYIEAMISMTKRHLDMSVVLVDSRQATNGLQV